MVARKAMMMIVMLKMMMLMVAEQKRRVRTYIGTFIDNECIDSALQKRLEQKKKRLQRLPFSIIPI